MGAGLFDLRPLLLITTSPPIPQQHPLQRNTFPIFLTCRGIHSALLKKNFFLFLDITLYVPHLEKNRSLGREGIV
jgi:hypothetical protein